jgi:hypothetical protein
VEELARRLEDEEGFLVWYDKWKLVPGDPSWQHEMARGLDQSKCCVVCIGELTLSGWFKEEIQRALNRQVTKDSSYRVIPLLLPGSNDENVDDFLENRTWVDFRDDSNLDYEFHRLICGIKGEQPGRWPIPKSPSVSLSNPVESKLSELRYYKEKGLIDENVHCEYQRKILDHFLIFDSERFGAVK